MFQVRVPKSHLEQPISCDKLFLLFASVEQRPDDVCWDGEGDPIPCAGSGQDGDLRPGTLWPRPRFTTSGDEVVLDRLTSLMWPVDANRFEWPLRWSDALVVVAGLHRQNHLGFDDWRDWRLPNRRELWSLESFATRNPALPEEHPFRNVFFGWYRSSTSAARNPAYAWSVQITGGRVFFEAKDRPAFYMAVPRREPRLPSTGQRFGLRRPRPPGPVGRQRIRSQRGASGGVAGTPFRGSRQWSARSTHPSELGPPCRYSCSRSVSWAEALAHVNELNQQRSATGEWRPPGITEPESLLEASRCDPSLPAGHPFTKLQSGYWSSTTSSST